jgi:hypothetical protein
VTTREAWAAERPVTDRRLGTTRADNGLRAGLHDRRHAAAVRPPPVVDGPPAGFGVSADVWPPASEPLLSGNPDFHSNADSTAAAGISGRILCASTRARRAVARWWNASARWYACGVPREVLLPQGPPGRLAESLPGTYFLSRVLEQSSSIISLRRPVSKRTSGRLACDRNSGRRKKSLPQREIRGKAKETEKDTIQSCLKPKKKRSSKYGSKP